MASCSFSNILAKKVVAPFKPVLNSEDDTSNFGSYDDSNTEVAEVSKANDPFLKWLWLALEMINKSIEYHFIFFIHEKHILFIR